MTRFAGGDDGSASVWVLAIAVTTLSLFWAVLLVGVAVSARHRAEASADFAALAGAAAARSGANGCVAAARVAAANRGTVLSCTVNGDASITVTVAVEPPVVLARWVTGPASATARAGS